MKSKTKTNTVAYQIFTSHFGKQAVAALGRKGITPVGMQALPGPDGSFLNSETGYCLNDNGTHRIRTYLEVKALAA